MHITPEAMPVFHPSTSAEEENAHTYAAHSTLSCTPRRRATTVSQAAMDVKLRRFNGAARSSLEWDGLRRDPELWFPDGDCLVYLAARGSSRRGPSFKVSYAGLLKKQCQPYLRKHRVVPIVESSISENGSVHDSYFSQALARQPRYEMYIPAPPNAERSQAMKYHIATRNFFAWMFGRSLVGSSLGTALIGVLISMNEHRNLGSNNAQDLLDFMDEEGYADMPSAPQHALAILHLAEHFQFKDLYIDAFTHCAGMFELLATYDEFEYIGHGSKILLQTARTQMDWRLGRCCMSLSTFLEEELSTANLTLSINARCHLDRFRSFLQAYYLAKLGYYPPGPDSKRSSTFPKHVLEEMHIDFESLYKLLADKQSTISQSDNHMGGLDVVQSVRAFDARHSYDSLPHVSPLMPEAAADVIAKRSSLFSSNSKSKLNLDGRLVALSALNKATNAHQLELYSNSLVRAYKVFEKECIFDSVKIDKSHPIAAAEARKIRWLLVYSMLQVLRVTTRVPEQVRDVENVKYHICISTTGCPPFGEELPIRSPLDIHERSKPMAPSFVFPPIEEQTFGTTLTTSSGITQKGPHRRSVSLPSGYDIPKKAGSRGSVHRAVSSLGAMPELVHPKPQRSSYSEILVDGYGNGSNEKPQPPRLQIDTDVASLLESSERPRKTSLDSGDMSDSGTSISWSNDDNSTNTAPSSVAGSPVISLRGKKVPAALLEKSMLQASYSVEVEDRTSISQPTALVPKPLRLKGPQKTNSFWKRMNAVTNQVARNHI